MIKPDFFQSESLGMCSMQARLAFVGLWTTSDDYGNQKLQLSRLKIMLFPYDTITDDEFFNNLKELESTGCIKCYEVDGKVYINIPNFNFYQTIRKPSKTENPPPNDEVLRSEQTSFLAECVTSAELVRHQYVTSASLVPLKEKNRIEENISKGDTNVSPFAKKEEDKSAGAVELNPTDSTRPALAEMIRATKDSLLRQRAGEVL